MITKYISSKRMKEIDARATRSFGIPSLLLMENAGRSVASEVAKVIKSKKKKILILCGYGNNGGDGFVVARHLVNSGYKVAVCCVGQERPMSNDARINFDIVKKTKIPVVKIRNSSHLAKFSYMLKKYNVVVDAIFGIGIRGQIGQFYCKLFRQINNADSYIISIDVPSGLNADTGLALPVAIKAQKTVTMGFAKNGFRSSFAKKYLGKVSVADISLPMQLKK